MVISVMTLWPSAKPMGETDWAMGTSRINPSLWGPGETKTVIFMVTFFDPYLFQYSVFLPIEDLKCSPVLSSQQPYGLG